MSEDSKDDILKNENNVSEPDNQSEVDQNNTTEEINQKPADQNPENQPSVEDNQSTNDKSDTNLTQQPEINNKETENKNEHQVIHKKDGRLHIYVRQDKYKGELKSKNWVGRLYIDGKQKIFSSGTTNLDEAIPILEKWFDDTQEESERLKNKVNNEEVSKDINTPEENTFSSVDKQTSQDALREVEKVQTPIDNTESQTQDQSSPVISNENTEISKQEQLKGKISNIFGKLKDINLKKLSFGNKTDKPSFNKSQA